MRKGVEAATREQDNKSVEEKSALLSSVGIDFKSRPGWERRGTGLYWEDFEKEGWNPKRRVKEVARRRRIRFDEELPAGPAYDRLLQGLLA